MSAKRAKALIERKEAEYLDKVKNTGDSEELVELSDLDANEFIDLVKSCDDPESLEMYKKFEEAHDDTPRKTVLKAIAKRLEEVKGE